MDSFANAPFQDSKTRAGQVIPIRDMVNEEQYSQLASTPKGENSLKIKFNPSASQAQAQRAKSIGCEESGGHSGLRQAATTQNQESMHN